MPRKHHKPEEIVAKLRQVDVLTSQGKLVADAIRAIGVTEVTYYLYGRLSHLWTALPLQGDFDLSSVASCKHLSGVIRLCWCAQMGNPLAQTSTAGRPRGPR